MALALGIRLVRRHISKHGRHVRRHVSRYVIRARMAAGLLKLSKIVYYSAHFAVTRPLLDVVSAAFGLIRGQLGFFGSKGY